MRLTNVESVYRLLLFIASLFILVGLVTKNEVIHTIGLAIMGFCFCSLLGMIFNGFALWLIGQFPEEVVYTVQTSGHLPKDSDDHSGSDQTTSRKSESPDNSN